MHTIEDLQNLMARLRDPETGCPWDLQQDFHTITASTIEEAYEVADAIERGDLDHLAEELGDLLFQVIFYSQLGREKGLFDFDSVVDTIVTKLVRRHPHVFPTGQLYGEQTINVDDKEEAAIKTNWEAIKSEERNAKGHKGILADVPVGLPSLSRAQKLQKRVARAGWDWRDAAGVIDKLDEELSELKQALAEQKANPSESHQAHVYEELGDLMFMTVNCARFLGFDAEHCLRDSNRKFERRIQAVESTLSELGSDFQSADNNKIDQAWEMAKSKESKM
jgi:ATP diphosphatase